MKLSSQREKGLTGLVRVAHHPHAFDTIDEIVWAVGLTSRNGCAS